MRTKAATTDPVRPGPRGPHPAFALAPLLLVVVAAVGAFANSFGGQFVFDDHASIRVNPHIRTLWPLSEAMSVPLWSTGATVDGRPLLSLSFALNRALLGPEPWGFHLVNLGIHVLAAMVLYGLVRRTLLREPFADSLGGRASWFAAAVAMLWAVHPLHTGSVTYMVQRAESLMGLLYLLTLYCAMRGMTAGEEGPAGPPPRRFAFLRFGRASWYLAAVVCCAVGAGVKEVTVTAPLVVYLYDAVFVSGSYRTALRRRWALYAGLLLSWGVIGGVYFANWGERQTDFTLLDPWVYFATELGVVLYYLRLAAWPEPLMLEYPWPDATAFWAIAPPALAMAILAGGTVWGLLRRRWWGFVGAWFLLILAPSSSIYPTRQYVSPHRMYLPLAAVVLLGVLGGRWALQYALRRWAHARWSRVPRAAAVGAVAVALGLVTVARNADYHDRTTLWQDALEEAVANVTAHYYLGRTYAERGELHQAVRHYRQGLEHQPDRVKLIDALARTLMRMGRYAQAEREYRRIVRAKPKDFSARNNLAAALEKQGKLSDAVVHYQAAAELQPANPKVRKNLGSALHRLGRVDEAIAHFQQGLVKTPSDSALRNNLAAALAGQGKLSEAVHHYSEGLRFAPDSPILHTNLADALARLGQADRALEHVERALELQPQMAAAHCTRGVLLIGRRQYRRALRSLRRSLQLNPNDPRAVEQTARLLATCPRADLRNPHQALALATRAVELTQRRHPQAWSTLAAAYALAGHYSDAVEAVRAALQLLGPTGRNTPLGVDLLQRLEQYQQLAAAPAPGGSLPWR